MDIQQLSASFAVRALTPEDTDSIYALCRGNELFYRFHPPFVTKESIAWDMTALPPGKSFGDKYYIGFFKDTRLAAVMDLIADYPSKGTAFIGFLWWMRSTKARAWALGLSANVLPASVWKAIPVCSLARTRGIRRAMRSGQKMAFFRSASRGNIFSGSLCFKHCL